MSEKGIVVECMECEKDMLLTDREQDDSGNERQYFTCRKCNREVCVFIEA